MQPNPSSRSDRLSALRAEVRALEGVGAKSADQSLPFGLPEVDDRLASAGLEVGALHEIAPARAELADEAAATLFLAGIAARLSGQILWVLTRRDLFAPGLARAGLGPDRVLYAECRSDEEVLAVMEEGLRHGGLAAAVGEVGRAPMVATRRLQLAAEEGGTAALMLLRWRKEDPLARPSAAVTRWRIGCAPSAPLPTEGVGRPRWSVELARQRGGATHNWILEGSDETGRLALPAIPADRAAGTGSPIRRAA